MKKTRKLILVALLMFMVAAATGGAYAYWAGTVNSPAPDTDAINITIGAGGSVSTVLNVTDPTAPTGKKLVPAGQKDHSVDSTNCYEFLEFEHSVKWESGSTGSASGATGTLTMAVTDKTIGGSDASAQALGVAYVKVEIWDPTNSAYQEVTSLTYAIVADGAAVGTKIKVTLLEPPTKVDYDKVATKAIVVSLSFSVAVI